MCETTATITGTFTIAPALTQEERQDLVLPYLDLIQEGEQTRVLVEGEGGRCDGAGYENDLKTLVRRIGPDRVHGQVQVWGNAPEDLCRLSIVDGRVWATYPQIIWPQD